MEFSEFSARVGGLGMPVVGVYDDSSPRKPKYIAVFKRMSRAKYAMSKIPGTTKAFGGTQKHLLVYAPN